MSKNLTKQVRGRNILKKFFPQKYTSWDKVPIMTKGQLSVFPVPATFLQLRITSGSTGDPLYVYYSTNSVKAFVKRSQISLIRSGVTSQDIVLNLFAYGNYVPGSMYEQACLKENITVLPLGAPNTYPVDKIIDAIIRIKPTVWLSVPSYALGLLSKLSTISKSSYFPSKVIVAGEPLLDAYIKAFQDYGVEVISHYGLTECPSIGLSDKSNPKVINVLSRGLYVEAVKYDDENYHLVVTDLNNTSMPIIRYDTNDLVTNLKFNKDNSLKSFTLNGRSDDLIKLRGTLTSKSKLISLLSKYGADFVIKLITKDGSDCLEITLPTSKSNNKADIIADLAFIKCKIELIFIDTIDIPKTISNKLRYFIDLRK